jgi:light-regulated signal transduction histidine kinase (bacteriophytochrome)
MESSGPHPAAGEIDRLRSALEAETQRRLEAQKQLERASADFEEFISIASHDLRESLRVVGSYAQLLAETYKDRLDPDGQLFLANMQDGVVRMQSLLTDIVAYWSADPVGRQPRRADM